MAITTLYKTTQGSEWNTKTQATLAEVFEQSSNIFFPGDYRQKHVVELLDKTFYFYLREVESLPTPENQEALNAALSVADALEQKQEGNSDETNR